MQLFQVITWHLHVSRVQPRVAHPRLCPHNANSVVLKAALIIVLIFSCVIVLIVPAVDITIVRHPAAPVVGPEGCGRVALDMADCLLQRILSNSAMNRF